VSKELVEGRHREEVDDKRGEPKGPLMKSKRFCNAPRPKKVERALPLEIHRPIYEVTKAIFDDPCGYGLIQP
jgi:hypothetical protein